MVGAIIRDVAGFAYERRHEHALGTWPVFALSADARQFADNPVLSAAVGEAIRRASRTGASQIGPDHRVRVRAHVATHRLRWILPRVILCRRSAALSELGQFERRCRDV